MYTPILHTTAIAPPLSREPKRPEFVGGRGGGGADPSVFNPPKTYGANMSYMEGSYLHVRHMDPFPVGVKSEH